MHLSLSSLAFNNFVFVSTAVASIALSYVILSPSIKSSKTHDGILTLSPRNGIAVVGLPTAVFRLPVDYEAENIAKMGRKQLNFISVFA